MGEHRDEEVTPHPHVIGKQGANSVTLARVSVRPQGTAQQTLRLCNEAPSKMSMKDVGPTAAHVEE